LATPYAVYFCFGALAVAALLSWYHNHARVLCIAVMVGLTAWSAGMDPVKNFAPLAAALLLPLNFALFAVLKEKGMVTFDGVFKAVLIGAQVLGVSLLAERDSEPFDSFLHRGDASAQSWMPWSVQLAFAATALILLILIFLRRTSVEPGLLWALAAVFAGLNQKEVPGALFLYCGGAGLILMFAILEHGYDIAYLDELTGLPGRRAFNEALRRLRRRYTIAMCDVDLFKTFNDSYGHDAGDQVLKMVAAALLEVKSGGRAFRYGGEEFALIFKGLSAVEAQPLVESVREAIARTGLVFHESGLPRGNTPPKSGASTPGNPVTITISIGVADHSSERITPEIVLEAADSALYRAKESGRNCVSIVGSASS
jgi:GGDEF domain-containing protein